MLVSLFLEKILAIITNDFSNSCKIELCISVFYLAQNSQSLVRKFFFLCVLCGEMTFARELISQSIHREAVL
jgi:hypothetical protein